MNDTSVLWKDLTSVFRKVFQDDNLVLTPDTKNDDIGNWNSLNHAILIETLEKKFEIEFEIDEVLTMQSVEEIYTTLQKKLDK